MIQIKFGTSGWRGILADDFWRMISPLPMPAWFAKALPTS